jgi:hypothetical protein
MKLAYSVLSNGIALKETVMLHHAIKICFGTEYIPAKQEVSYDSLGLHGSCDFEEPGNIGADHIVAGFVVFFSS